MEIYKLHNAKMKNKWELTEFLKIKLWQTENTVWL